MHWSASVIIPFGIGLLTLVASHSSADRGAPRPIARETMVHNGDIPAPAVNLGDCLRSASAPLGWPADYAAICADLQREFHPPGIAKKSEAPKIVEARTAPAPLPLQRPARRQAQHAPAIRATCRIDADGMTRLDKAGKRQSRPPELASARIRGTSGMALLVPAGCEVESPAEAKVLFAGSFKGYRGVVILELAGKRHLIVAGLGALSVSHGGRVARGGELGTTSDERAPALAGAFGAGAPLLFFDVRNSRGGAEPVFWLARTS